MRKHKSLFGTALALIASMTLVACSSGSSSSGSPSSNSDSDSGSASSPASGQDGPSGSDEKVTITMATFLDPTASDPRSKVLADLIKSFESDHPNVTINVQTKPYQTLTSSFLSQASAGNAPDITWTVLYDLSTVVNQDALVDLSKVNVFDKDDISDFSIWNALQVNGNGPYGVVLSLNYFGLMYRADMLKKAGIDPASLTTWDAFDKAVKALTDKSAGVYGYGQQFGGDAADPQIMVPRCLDDQESLFKSDGSANWDTDACAEALKFETDMVADGITPQGAVQWDPNDLYDQFAAGKLAIINSASTRVSAMQGQLGADKVGFIPYPGEKTGDLGHRTFNGWSVGVWSGSKHQQIAAEFVASLESKKADVAWTTEAGQVPLRKSTLDGADVPDFVRAAAQGIADHGQLPPLDAITTKDWQKDLNGAALDVILKGATPSDALKSAAEALSKRQSAAG